MEIVVDGPAASPRVKAAIGRLTNSLASDKSFGPVQVLADKAGDLTLLQTPVSGTASGDLAVAKVRELRSTYIPRAFAEGGARVYVTGESRGAASRRRPKQLLQAMCLRTALLVRQSLSLPQRQPLSRRVLRLAERRLSRRQTRQRNSER